MVGVMVGSVDGDNVVIAGVSVGCVVDISVGCEVGILVGGVVGFVVGSLVGIIVGVAVLSSNEYIKILWSAKLVDYLVNHQKLLMLQYQVTIQHKNKIYYIQDIAVGVCQSMNQWLDHKYTYLNVLLHLLPLHQIQKLNDPPPLLE